MRTAEEVLLQGVEIFRKLRIRYVIHGGIALNYWGRPRATGDIDFMAIVDEAKVGRINNYAKEKGWEAKKELPNRLNLYPPGGKLYLEVWFARSEFEKNVVNRGITKRIDNAEYVLASPEDTIVLKLLRFTALDAEDILSVMDKQGERIDCRYVIRWSSRLRETYARLLRCIEKTAYRDFWKSCQGSAGKRKSID